MASFKSDFLNIMQERGFIYQISDETGLDEILSKNQPVTAYIGFDTTAPSLHAGSLIQIMTLYWFQKTGHRPIVLLGGATSMIGDPSFRDEARKMLFQEEIEKNLQGIKKNFIPYLSFGTAPTDFILENNADWLHKLSYIDLLRDIGQHFSINRMLSFDSVKLRLQQDRSLSFLEFNYMILQAYDFTELARRHGCQLQMGGSDQWGNIINGIDLGRRTGTPPLFALTTPLLTTSSGAKMGKSASGAIWLAPNMYDPYDFWQYWRNVEDNDVTRFLKLYTSLPLNEIEKLNHLGGSEINEAKKILATEVTSMLHGEKIATQAQKAAEETFEKKILAEHLPEIGIDPCVIEKGIGILSLLVHSGLTRSNSEGRRLLKEGAVSLNDKKILQENMIIDRNHLEKKEVLKLSLGKKKHILIRAKQTTK